MYDISLELNQRLLDNDSIPSDISVDSVNRNHQIYMEQGHELCGYAKEMASANTSMDNQQMWMIIGIVFICLFAISLGVVIYLCYKLKDDAGNAGYQPTSHEDV